MRLNKYCPSQILSSQIWKTTDAIHDDPGIRTFDVDDVRGARRSLFHCYALSEVKISFITHILLTLIGVTPQYTRRNEAIDRVHDPSLCRIRKLQCFDDLRPVQCHSSVLYVRAVHQNLVTHGTTPKRNSYSGLSPKNINTCRPNPRYSPRTNSCSWLVDTFHY